MVFRERRPSRHRAQEGELPQVASDHELESFLASLGPSGSSAGANVADTVVAGPLADPAAAKAPAEKGGKPAGRRLPHVERDTDNAAERTTRFSNTQVFQLRVPELRGEALRTVARERGISPTAMMLEWVLERLDREEKADQAAVAPSPRREADPVPARAPLDEPATLKDLAPLTGLVPLEDYVPPPGELLQPATALLGADEPVAPLSPVDQLNPVGELTTVDPSTPPPAAPVTPLFRHAGAHASSEDGEPKPKKGPRHRAPEPVTSLHTRRKF